MDDVPEYEDAPAVWQPEEEPDAIGEPIEDAEPDEDVQAVAEQRNLLDDEYRRGAGLPPRGGTLDQ